MAAYELIATNTLGVGTTSVTFSSIPATYNHLELRTLIRLSDASNVEYWRIRFNSDTGANYNTSGLWWIGGMSPYSATSATSILPGRAPANTATSNYYGVGQIFIPNYNNTNRHKAVVANCAYDISTIGNGHLMTQALWMSTSAVSAITIFSNGGGNIAAGSVFSLYGIGA